MMFRRSVFIFLLMAIARTPSSFDTRSNAFAWALVVHRAAPCKPPSVSIPATATWSCVGRNNNIKKNSGGNSCLYSSVASPRRGDVGGSIDDHRDDDDNDEYNYIYDQDKDLSTAELWKQQEKLTRVCDLLQAEPRDLLRFEKDDSSGLRGMYLNHSVESGEIILKIPLGSCLTDDRSPSWLHEDVKNDPYRWATRLAASWADLHLKNKPPAAADADGRDATNDDAHKLWSSLLPDPQHLSASLPVHWPETTVVNARSTALELAVDSAFFARAEAVADLVRGFQQSPYADIFSNDKSKDVSVSMNELAHHALDLVQTRSCRLEDENGADDQSCRRVLAPVFDFINHGSRNVDGANAYFSLEEECLVVRSMKDVSRDEEVTIDYGDSARPAWKCLLSYGFVSEYKRTTSGAEDGENLAEVYMKGVRYEVADDSIPPDMVADASPQQWVEDNDDDDVLQTIEDDMTPPIIVLTPDIALRIAERIADAAYYLLLEPEQILDDGDSNTVPPTAFEVISTQLAAKLRWSQHRILLTCAAGLTQFAKEQESAYQ